MVRLLFFSKVISSLKKLVLMWSLSKDNRMWCAALLAFFVSAFCCSEYFSTYGLLLPGQNPGKVGRKVVNLLFTCEETEARKVRVTGLMSDKLI